MYFSALRFIGGDETGRDVSVRTSMSIPNLEVYGVDERGSRFCENDSLLVTTNRW